MRILPGLTETDVAFGRGNGTNLHPGNDFFRRLVDERRHAYRSAAAAGNAAAAAANARRRIVDDIVGRVRGRSPPGRFVDRDPDTGGWKQAHPASVRKKVGDALRGRGGGLDRAAASPRKSAPATGGGRSEPPDGEGPVGPAPQRLAPLLPDGDAEPDPKEVLHRGDDAFAGTAMAAVEEANPGPAATGPASLPDGDVEESEIELFFSGAPLLDEGGADIVVGGTAFAAVAAGGIGDFQVRFLRGRV